MLPKPNRLRKTKDFKTVLGKGKSVREDGLLLKIRASNSPISRFGIIVSTKVEKKATKRNRIRRLVSEAIRHQLGNVHAGSDAVVVALQGLHLRNIHDTEKIITNLFKKAAIIK